MIHGSRGSVYWNSTAVHAYLNGAGMDVSIDNADVTVLQQGWRENLKGLASGTLSFAGFVDAAQKEVLYDQLGTNGGVLTYCPGGDSAVGDRARLVSATSTSLGSSSTLDDAVALAWDVTSQTYIAFGDVLHPFGEDTNTTTGTGKDDAAQTTTGWVAHLHVTLVDGGSWVVKLQDSADNSNWLDVSGGAFTAATGATSQRLASASGATLRRYVRYVATRTGGSAGNGITFHLSYSRERAA
jgi:hypothetical protein